MIKVHAAKYSKYEIRETVFERNQYWKEGQKGNKEAVYVFLGVLTR